MSSVSLDEILRRARALCVSAGVDPDQPAHDGRPEWFRFFGQARASLRRDRQAQDPLELLKALDAGALPGGADAAQGGSARESFDPLARLQELYEKERGQQQARATHRTHASSYELGAPDDLKRAVDTIAPTRAAGRAPSDPLEELKAIETIGGAETTGDETARDAAVPARDRISDRGHAPAQPTGTEVAIADWDAAAVDDVEDRAKQVKASD